MTKNEEDRKELIQISAHHIRAMVRAIRESRDENSAVFMSKPYIKDIVDTIIRLMELNGELTILRKNQDPVH